MLVLKHTLNSKLRGKDFGTNLSIKSANFEKLLMTSIFVQVTNLEGHTDQSHIILTKTSMIIFPNNYNILDYGIRILNNTIYNALGNLFQICIEDPI